MRTATLISLCILALSACSTSVVQQNRNSSSINEADRSRGTNLGPPVNIANHAEFAPSISADGRTLVFESNRSGSFKLYLSTILDSGWSKPERLDNISSGSWDGAPFLSYDGNYLLLSSYREGGLGDNDIWISERLGDKWRKPVNMGLPINSPSYDGFASLTPDGNDLYFMREAISDGSCEAKLSVFDIYTSRKMKGRWSVPVKLPHPINTDACERVPVILADGVTLIFGSTRDGGFGGYDLYKTIKLSDETWSEPVNLGAFINTSGDDEGISIPASGDIMYYASGDYKSNLTDLYTVPIPAAMRPTTVITVTGIVSDAKSNKPLQARIDISDIETGNTINTVVSNGMDGSYVVILNKGKQYDVSVSTERYSFHTTSFDLRELEEYDEYKRDIALQPIEVGSKIVLNNIYFNTDSDSLLQGSKYELDRLIKIMNEHKGMVIEVSAHTDNVASKKYNIDLSSRRAQSVANYLIVQGVDKKRFLVKGYGESQPIADNKTEAGRQKNRRVEFTIREI
jgi:outer membrane protein OmpA-like peptidoglycan-associated protein